MILIHSTQSSRAQHADFPLDTYESRTYVTYSDGFSFFPSANSYQPPFDHRHKRIVLSLL